MVGVEELLLVLTSPGDGVIVNPPVYPPYFADIAHAGRRVVTVPLLGDGALDLDGIDRGLRGAAPGRCCSATRTTRRGGCCRWRSWRRCATSPTRTTRG